MSVFEVWFHYNKQGKMKMNRNVKIAKELVRIAKCLAASDDWTEDTYEVDGKPGLSYDETVELAKKALNSGRDIKIYNEVDEEDVCFCSWCEDLFPASDCEKEENMGWLCENCLNELISRGEHPTIEHRY